MRVRRLMLIEKLGHRGTGIVSFNSDEAVSAAMRRRRCKQHRSQAALRTLNCEPCVRMIRVLVIDDELPILVCCCSSV